MKEYKKILIKEKDGKFKYPILIGDGIIKNLNLIIKKQVLNKKVFIIYDDFFGCIVKKNTLFDSLKMFLETSSKNFYLISIKAGDKNKNFIILKKIINEILKNKIERNSLIITFGGGVVGDIGGFVSAIILRGVNYIQIPTTLLAQVDSSVGGKTGINTLHGKNLVGNFHQPISVIIDSNLLKSLPKREFCAGLAEVIKYSLIKDKNFFKFLNLNYKNILNLKKPYIEKAIFTSCKIKSKIVSEDEKEKGVRAFLNLGHTFAHAFEALLNYKSTLIHGEAVAIGMCMAFRLSNKLKICKKEEVTKVESLVKKYKLPISLSNVKDLKFTPNKILKKLYLDKKVANGKLTFILCKSIGNPVIKNDINEKFLFNFLKEELNG